MAEPRVACPTCKRETVFAPSNPWRPFCCERCRQIDLGAWATEKFRVAAEPVEDDGDAPPAAPAQLRRNPRDPSEPH